MLKRQITSPAPNYVFNKIKNIVVFLYDYKCQVCNLKFKNLHVHHLDNNHSNNDVDNLIPLCKSCHRIAHKGFKIEKTEMTIFRFYLLSELKKYKEFLEN